MTGAAVIVQVLDFLDSIRWSEVREALLRWFWLYLLPLGIAVCALAGFAKLLNTLKRWIIPPSPQEIHDEAKRWYRKGWKKEAVKAWTQNDPMYAPSILSLACHEIYVDRQTSRGIKILRDAQKRKVPNLGPRRVEKMIMDAKAISDGHSAMVDMNAQKAEYEFLGVGFWS